MTSPPDTTDTAQPIRIAYWLTAEDVGRYVGAEGLRCWTCQVRSHKAATALLGGLVLGLATLSGMGSGVRSGWTILGSAAGLFGIFGWARGSLARRRAGRLSLEMGLPREIRVSLSPMGIAKASGPSLDEPGRRYAWSEVVEAYAAPGLVVLRLRPAEAVLLVPDRAFPDPKSKQAFVEKARRWHRNALDLARSHA